MGRLDNKVAIVTGAASGMGRATAKLFAKEGAKVIAADINLEGVQQVVESINAENGEAIAQFVDIGSPEKLEEMILKAKEQYGRLDILINNAARLNLVDEDVVSMDIEQWDESMRYNLRSVMVATKHAIPLMLENGGGSIVNIASLSGMYPELVRTAYAAAKAGVIALTKSTAVQYGKSGIRCNAIAPGMVLAPEIVENGPAELKAYAELFIDAKLTTRIGVPEDIAYMALYLASDEASFITGQVMQADGGMATGNPPNMLVRKLGHQV